MPVTTRRKAIQELVNNNAISDQKELVHLLKKQYGITAGQAVISRDLRALHALKKTINGTLSYEIGEIDISTEILRLALIDISHNETTIVIKTHAGLAAFVGDLIDQHHDLEILGSLAGENVVFIAPKSIKKIQKTTQKICEKFHFKKRS